MQTDNSQAMAMNLSGDWLMYRDLAIALAAGLLIGVERGWTMRDEHRGGRVAGIRTFGLIAGRGGLDALIAQSLNLIFAAILLAAVVIMLAISHARTIHEPDGRSITNFVVSVLALCLGLLAVSGYPALAMAGAAIVAALLAMRSELHGVLRKLGPTDINATIRFALIALAVLPFLPARAFGPYDAFNLQQLWFVVILVTGLSFAGYVANRIFGESHGTVVTAVIGGAYSSTAVTASPSAARALARRCGSRPVIVTFAPAASAAVAVARPMPELPPRMITALSFNFVVIALLPRRPQPAQVCAHPAAVLSLPGLSSTPRCRTRDR